MYNILKDYQAIKRLHKQGIISYHVVNDLEMIREYVSLKQKGMKKSDAVKFLSEKKRTPTSCIYRTLKKYR